MISSETYHQMQGVSYQSCSEGNVLNPLKLSKNVFVIKLIFCKGAGLYIQFCKTSTALFSLGFVVFYFYCTHIFQDRSGQQLARHVLKHV